MTSLNSPPEKTLYRRLGGYDVIAAVLDGLPVALGAIPGWRGLAGGEVWTPASAPVSCWSTKCVRSRGVRVYTSAGT